MGEKRFVSVVRAILGLALVSLSVAGPAVGADVEATVKSIERVAGGGPFRPDWGSLAEFKVPEWYQDAKFGIFIHWGAYSVPAYGNEWYPREMYNANRSRRGIYQHHLKT